MISIQKQPSCKKGVATLKIASVEKNFVKFKAVAKKWL